MRWLAVALGAVLLVGACAAEDPFLNESALPAAKIRFQEGAQACFDQQTHGAFKTSTAAVNCQLAVDLKFASDVHMHAMEVYDAYAAQARTIAAQVDMGYISLDEGRRRFAEAQKAYGAGLRQAGQQWASSQAKEQAEASAALMVMGAALAGGAAAYQAATPSTVTVITPAPVIQPPMNCRTVFVANIARTQCF